MIKWKMKLKNYFYIIDSVPPANSYLFTSEA